jgi:hypothetical protein
VTANFSPCFPEGGGMGAAESKTTTFRQAMARLDLSGGLLDQLTCENVTSVQVEDHDICPGSETVLSIKVVHVNITSFEVKRLWQSQTQLGKLIR